MCKGEVAMNAKEIKEKLTLEHVLILLEELGAEPRESNNQNEILCKTVCHNGHSHKLYLFKNTLNFHCFTNCGSVDILQIVQNALDLDLRGAITHIARRFNFYKSTFKYGFGNDSDCNDLNVVMSFTKSNAVAKDKWIPFNIIDEDILNEFYDFYHESFYGDGIGIYAMSKFGIKYDILNQRIIIPHRGHDGKLIAVRCRNLDQELIDRGMKYIPIVIKGKRLSTHTGQYFYGYYYNRHNIRKCKVAILVESEKAVMQYETMYPDKNITLALSSSNLSNFQIDYLKELGVQEVILALDKEFERDGTEQAKLYESKLKKSIVNRLNFCRVSVIWDTNGLIGYKDSPLDKGKETFEILMRNRIYIDN